VWFAAGRVEAARGRLGWMVSRVRAEAEPRLADGVPNNADDTRAKGAIMNWDRIQGNWKQMTGKVKEQWGKLTDDDVAQINGNREQLEGKIQARYGYGKDQVKKEIDDWIGRM
jgi:uncharacterized protein YjbJ (UPF0337 family)